MAGSDHGLRFYIHILIRGPDTLEVIFKYSFTENLFKSLIYGFDVYLNGINVQYIKYFLQ